MHSPVAPPFAGPAPTPPEARRPPRAPASVAPELTERLRPLTGLLVQDVTREIRLNIPAYARPLGGRAGAALTHVVRTTIDQCFDHIARTSRPHRDWKPFYRRLGRWEFAAGRTMDPLQTAVRVGARVVWRDLSTSARSLSIPPEKLLGVADAIFAWVDELSAVAIDGYIEAQADAQVDHDQVLDRSRKHLVRAILSGEPSAQEWLHALADAAGWPLPDRLLTIAVEPLGDRDTLAALTQCPQALVGTEGSMGCVLLPHPGCDEQFVFEVLGERRAAVGPVVTPAEANRSFGLARRMLGLMQATNEPRGPVVWCRDHLATLLLLADPFVTSQLYEHTDDAFAGLTPKQRNRMATTLLAWLQTRGTHTEMAARLDVHPQTVRYRINQLQQLLGDRLADPEARLTLELALRAHTLLDPRADRAARHPEPAVDFGELLSNRTAGT